MRRNLLGVAGCVLACAVLPAVADAQDATVVYLVRHAEKESQPAADPPLTAAGRERADALAAVLADAGIDGIVTTQFLRTRATAEPLARQRGLTPDVLQAAGRQHPAQVATHLMVRYRGRTVLVVGHSNTIPAIIAALGGPRMPDLCDPEYAGLYVLIIRANGTVSLARASYGAADPPDAAACRTGG